MNNKTVQRLIDCIQSMEQWNAYQALSFFINEDKVDAKAVFKEASRMGVDANLDGTRRSIFNYFMRTVYWASKYPICLKDKIIIKGREITMEEKNKAMNLIKAYNIPESNIYFKACLQKVMEDVA